MTRPTCLAPEDMLCFDVYATNQAFGRLYKSFLDPMGLTYPQYLVMSVLWNEAPLSVSDIVRRLRLETSTLTPLLKRLEAQELVVRTRSREDERRVDISLGDKGEALREDAAAVPGCVEAATGLDRGQLDRLRTGLSALRTALRAE